MLLIRDGDDEGVCDGRWQTDGFLACILEIDME